MKKQFMMLPVPFILLTLLGLFLPSEQVWAKLAPLDSRAITDSEEPFERRVYGYAMDVDSLGNVHIVYTKPIPNTNSGQVIYERRLAGVWQTPQILSNQGWIATRSTHLLVAPDNTVHICYITGNVSGQNLVYRKVVNGALGSERNVSPGGWHSQMQLDDAGRAMFIREGDNYPDPGSRFKLFTTNDDISWTERATNLINSNQFTIGNFIYSNGKYHLTYGDGAYTKPVLKGKGSNEYIDGKFHNFYYASSSDGITWTPSLVDDSGTLYEMEFWTSLIINNEVPVLSFFKYDEYNQQYGCGTSLLMAQQYDGNKWKKRIIAGSNFPYSDAGMGASMVSLGSNDIIAAWNDSPLSPIDFFEQPMTGGTVLFRSGADGSWQHGWLLDPFSAEGTVILRVNGNRLYSLVLGDWEDTKLYFREYIIPSISDIPPAAVPMSPSNGSIASGTFMMDWSTINSADYYRMWLYKDGQKYTDIWRQGAANSEHWVGSTLPAGNYEWWVQRFVSGAGKWSFSSAFQVGANSAPLLPPNELSASYGQYRGVALSWQPVEGADSYSVYRHTAPLPIHAQKVGEGIIGTSFVDSGADNGMVYYYWVKAVRNGISSSFGSSAPGFSDITKPAPPVPSTGGSINPGIYLLLQ